MQGVPVIPGLDRLSPRARFAIVIVLRLVVAAVFAAAAFPKLLDPTSFAADIDRYHIVPEMLVGPMAVALPVLELAIVAALVTGIHAQGGALVAAAMLLVFAAGMGQAMARGIDLSCGCFGEATDTQVSGLTIARNLVLTLACVPIVLGPRRASPPPAESPEESASA